MKIVYVHHGNRKKGNPSTQNDDLTEIGYAWNHQSFPVANLKVSSSFWKLFLPT